MNKELNCPNCQQKDREIARLEFELEQLHYILSRIFEMAKWNGGMLYFKQDGRAWEIETGKDS